MSERLPRITPNKIIKVLKKLGFSEVRQSGSHKIFKNKSGDRITVPYHSGKTLHPKLLKSILRDAELSLDELKRLEKTRHELSDYYIRVKKRALSFK